MKLQPIVLLATAAFAAPATAAAPVAGKWLTAERDSIVEIAPCGPAICGRVARVLKTMADGRAPTDLYNPDPALRARPVQGMTVLSGFTDGGSLWNGRIYDPKSGKSYRSKLVRNPDGTLNVQGCIAFFCKAYTWTAVR